MSALPAQVALAALTDGVRFVVCDLETTPSDTGERVISAGIVQVNGRGQELAAPVYWLCNPGCKIENTRIHGLADADVVNEPPFSAHLDELAAQLSVRPGETDIVFVAHNAGYDLSVLHLEHARVGRALADVTVLDTYALARYLRIAAGSFRLQRLLAYYGLPATDAHHALADASDTAALLQRLLEEAARRGAEELPALLDAAQGKRLRSGDYDAREPKRNTRARSRSPFTFVERPEAHLATHRRLPAKPSPAQLEAWLDGLRECVEFRCPLLGDRVRTLRSSHEAILEELVERLEWTVAFDYKPDSDSDSDSRVTINTILGPIAELARGHLRSAEATEVYDRVAEALEGFVSRCGTGASPRSPYDACPACRAGDSCPADTWWQPFAAALTGHRIDPDRIGVWLGSNGRLAEHAAAGRVQLAAHAAWRLVDAADRRRPEKAEAIAQLADDLELVEPRLLLRRVRALASTGDLDDAVEAATNGLAARSGSTDLAWRDLLVYRDALIARRHAPPRLRLVRPHRVGRSAPAERPQRRRFTLARGA